MMISLYQKCVYEIVFILSGQHKPIDARTPLREGDDDDIGLEERGEGALFSPNAIYMSDEETRRLQEQIAQETQNPLLLR